MKLLTVLLLLVVSSTIGAQNNFKYRVELDPVVIPNMPGIHSYAFAQHEGKWLFIGGRLDGIHARQPFNAFPENQNNSDIYVVDVQNSTVYSASVNALPTGIQEQLQSTNMNFYQDNDSLYIIGGYAYSATAADHKTFDNLTSVDVPGLIDAVINGNAINSFFKQISDPIFAVTGGQLGKIEDTFYLVGGHRFDGRYNPMGHNTFTQTYTNAIRKFKINNSGTQLSYTNYQEITDQVHLRRRDYNLLPHVYPNGDLGYVISSGVFQINADLPFLYPVEITASGYTPVTGFNQYLSHYHSAKTTLYNSSAGEMYSLLFGGMSQYYYDNGMLIQDDDVPFVNTISMLVRFSDGSYQEAKLQEEMPGLKGSSAEFIHNDTLVHFSNEVIDMSTFNTDTVLIGHIVGGISSPSKHPFTNNNTGVTEADASVYAVRLIFDELAEVETINVDDATDFELFPNPAKSTVNFKYTVKDDVTSVRYLITDVEGKLVENQPIEKFVAGSNQYQIDVSDFDQGVYSITLILDEVYYNTQKMVIQK